MPDVGLIPTLRKRASERDDDVVMGDATRPQLQFVRRKRIRLAYNGSDKDQQQLTSHTAESLGARRVQSISNISTESTSQCSQTRSPPMSKRESENLNLTSIVSLATVSADGGCQIAFPVNSVEARARAEAEKDAADASASSAAALDMVRRAVQEEREQFIEFTRRYFEQSSAVDATTCTYIS